MSYFHHFMERSWTNRYSSEFTARSGGKPLHKRGWITGTLWTSEKPSAQATREEALTAVHRAAHIQQHGFAVTLRELIAPRLDTKDYPIVITSLFGDVAAASPGYTPLGLSERAGFALALRDARIKLSGKNEN